MLVFDLVNNKYINTVTPCVGKYSPIILFNKTEVAYASTLLAIHDDLKRFT